MIPTPFAEIDAKINKALGRVTTGDTTAWVELDQLYVERARLMAERARRNEATIREYRAGQERTVREWQQEQAS